MKKFLTGALLALTLALAAPARADWGTSSAEPVNLPGACFYPSDGYANMRGMTDFICTWEMDRGEYYFNDTLGRRADLCYGNPGVGDVDVVTTDQKYCTRVHGLAATSTVPYGFKMGWDYFRWVGFFGIDMDNFWVEEQIGSFRLGPSTHAMFCAGDLTGPADDLCRGQSQRYVFNSNTTTVVSGSLSFVPHALTVGSNAAGPIPICPYLSSPSGVVPTKWLTCTSVHPTGLTLGVAGDGFPRSGGYAVIGNPVTGPGGAPCLGTDQTGATVVLVYPVQGAATTNPDGSPAFTPVCP